MTLQQFLVRGSELLGLAEKSLPDSAKISALEASNAKLSADFSALQSQLSEASNSIKEKDAKISTLEASNKEQSDKLATFDAEVEKVASAKALQIAASQGVPAPLKISNQTNANELTGLERAIAANRAERNQKN